MKLEINHWKRNEKKNDYTETKLQAAKKPMGQQWNQRGNLELLLNKWQWSNHTKTMRCSKSSSKREVHSDTRLPQKKKKKISNKQPNLSPEELEKKQ